MTDQAKPTAVSELTFERAVDELERIVARLERGDVALDESIAIYARGEELKKHCEKLLNAAEARVEKSGSTVRASRLEPSRSIRPDNERPKRRECAAMSFFPGQDPEFGDAQSCNAVSQLIIPRTSDIGGFEVRRALPTIKRRLVGPFIFFDRMGPARFGGNGEALDVKPHPHIGLSTVTYLTSGEIGHRDTLGNHTIIRPGDVNLMTAGRGIVHSERTPDDLRLRPHALSGVQTASRFPSMTRKSTRPLVTRKRTLCRRFRKTASAGASSWAIFPASRPMSTRTPTRCSSIWRSGPAPVSHFLPSMRNARSTFWTAKSKSPAMSSDPSNCWFSPP
nr:exodeoxyribonuclease VII small subunit [Marinicella sp. W31]MDC2877766.1 exodeoxyribonuclease VII small subunit [Marinicella sp. W31]